MNKKLFGKNIHISIILTDIMRAQFGHTSQSAMRQSKEILILISVQLAIWCKTLAIHFLDLCLDFHLYMKIIPGLTEML